MAKPRALNDRHLAYRVVGSQIAIALMVTILWWWFKGSDAALVALGGGFIAVTANGYFALQAFRYSGARATDKMLKAFYRGEAGKFVIVMLLFMVAFRYIGNDKPQAITLITAFIVVQSVSWFAPLLFNSRNGPKGEMRK